MVTETITAQASGEAPQIPPAPEPDYKLEAEKLKGELDQLKGEKGQLEQNLRSIKGASRQALDEAREIGRLRRSIEVLNQQVGLVMRGQIEGDPEKLTADAQKLEASLQQEERTLSLQEELAEDWSEIGRTIAEAKGLPCETEADAIHIAEVMQADPKLRGIYDLVRQAYDGKPRLIRQALRQAQELWRDGYVERHRVTQEAAKQAQAQVKQEKEASLNLEAGKGVGGGTLSDEEFFQRYGAEPSKYNTPADHTRAAKIQARM